MATTKNTKLDRTSEPSSTYIPIFECHTGKRCIASNNGNANENMVPILSNRSCKDDRYVVPRTSSFVNNSSDATKRSSLGDYPIINYKLFPSSLTTALEKCRHGNSFSQVIKSNSEELSSTQQPSREPPPRPPKPESWKNRSKSESCSSLPETNVYNYNKKSVNESSSEGGTPSIRHTSLDDSYDFPKPHDPTFCNIPFCQINKNKTNAYTNAPPGHCDNKDFRYSDCNRILLPVFSNENNVAMNNLESCDKNLLTTNFVSSAFSSNDFFLSTPPAVNRDLKPKRKGSDSDVASSPTTPTPLLSPSPCSSNINTLPYAQLRKQSPLPVNATPPKIPPRTNPFHHLREPSMEDENHILLNKPLRRNSSNEEQGRRSTSIGTRNVESNRLTYLDLDLDSDSCSSPRTPNLFENEFRNNTSPISFDLNRGGNGHNSNCNGSDSIVYKTVDWMKTEAFNKTKMGLEKSQRSSQ